jgi:ketosteroid isomerase-like protein
MAPSNVEIVRGFIDGVQALVDGRDPGRAFDAVADDAVLVPAAEVPGRESYRGIDGFAAFMRIWTEAFESWSFELEQVVDAGENRVAIVAYQRGLGKGSGAPVDLRFGGVCFFEEGVVVRTQLYIDPAEAFAVAGLGPP